jgi:hypothetical protein
MKKSPTSVRTASWQYDSMTEANGMDNSSNHPSYKMNTKYCGNQQSGTQDPNQKINVGRGPTVGNKGCDIEGPACPPTSAVPSVPKQGSVRDSINRGGQVRTPGGTRNWMPSGTQNYKGNIDSMNVGRGPTKGNSQ